ncbi:MAG: toprim domain-containing protein [Thiogranum sp.]
MTNFSDAIRAAGLEPPDHIEAGRIHRFPGIGKRNGNQAGWCKLFDDGQGGVFGDWSTGMSDHWQAEHDKPMTAAERDAFQSKLAEARRQADTERKAKQAEAESEAARIWDAATPAPADHPYLTHKHIAAHDLRMHDGSLVVPLRDPGGNLRSLQFISDDGGKKYLTGAAVKGKYWTVGNLTAETPYLYVCEGAATAATIHAAMQGCTVAAMSAGNLKSVAEALHSKYPGVRIIVCADDDHGTDGNPGVTAAGDAAKASRGIVAVPQFQEPRDPKATDWNDLAIAAGLKTVKSQIDDLMATVDSFESPPQADGKQFSAEDAKIVAELAALPLMEYDRQRNKVAKQLSVRATTLDRLVAERREQVAAAAEVDGVVEELEPWTSSVRGGMSGLYWNRSFPAWTLDSSFRPTVVNDIPLLKVGNRVEFGHELRAIAVLQSCIP